jgi:DNA repair exonuclease SbcCD ATPase subunit
VWIKRIELLNWGPFRGEHRLDLEPKAYAVTAKLEGDSARSNYLGKSFLGEAIKFALDGWLNPERPFDNREAWISRGETGGHVRLTFDDDSSALRSKNVGESAQTRYFPPGGGENFAKQDRADEEIATRLGMSSDDSLFTWFIAQQQAGFIVQAEGKRLDEVFGAWLQLDRLDRAIARVEGSLRTTELEIAKHDARVAAAREQQAARGDIQVLSGEETKAWEALVQARRESGGVEARYKAAVALAVFEEKLAQAERLEEEGAKLRAEYDAMDHDGRKRAHEAAMGVSRDLLAVSRRHGEEAIAAGKLAAGEFDGVCPVGKMQCPVSADLLARRSQNKKNAELAIAAARTANKETTAAEDLAGAAFAKVLEADRLAERLQTMRDQVEKLYASLPEEMPEHEDVQVLAEFRRVVQQKVETAVAVHANAKMAREGAEAVEKTLRDMAPALAKLRHRASVLQASALVLRRARREIAQSAMGEIQDAANSDLAEMGSGISAEMRWEHPGRGLAKECEECGRAFPDSARVRSCECGATRGPAVVRRLDCRLSKWSGGAKDLAGLTLQLAAARWLREERGSAWEFAFVDEPAAALDESLRRALAAHLPRLLASAGVRQALVVSHDPRAASALPGRIQVTSDGEWSKVEVVA